MGPTSVLAQHVLETVQTHARKVTAIPASCQLVIGPWVSNYRKCHFFPNWITLVRVTLTCSSTSAITGQHKTKRKEETLMQARERERNTTWILLFGFKLSIFDVLGIHSVLGNCLNTMARPVFPFRFGLCWDCRWRSLTLFLQMHLQKLPGK